MSPYSKPNTLMKKFIFLFSATFLWANSFMACFARTEINLDSDQSALLAFKAQIRFDPQHILVKNWSTTTPVCNWIGISCGVPHERVTVLNLSNMGLKGTISPYLGNLSFIASLILSNNTFHGHVPEELGHLHRLKEIDLGYNSLSGEVPSWFGSLPELEVLVMIYNSFNGVIPPSLGNITSLVVMRLSANHLEGHIPKAIGNLSSLKILRLGYNQLSGSIQFIFNMSSLEEIILPYNNLYGPIPGDMCSQLPNVKEIALDSNQFQGLLPSNWYKCGKLRMLSLTSNKFTGSIPRGIGNLTMLKSLYLENNTLKGEIPHEIGDLNLEELAVAQNGLVGHIPSSIFNTTSLKLLNLSNNNLSGSLPWDMCLHAPKLESIELHYNKAVTGGIPTSIGNCTSLMLLYLGGLNLTGVIPQEIGNLNNLGDLDMGYNRLKGPIPTTIFNITTLEYLFLVDNHLSGTLPSSMGIWLPNLKEICLGWNNLNGIVPDSISNASRTTKIYFGFNQFSGTLPKSLGSLELLEDLMLSNNNFTRESSSMELSFFTSLTNCRRLRKLDVDGNPFNGILPVSIGNLSTSLQSLDASFCEIKGNIPSEISNLTNLAFLKLSGNDINGLIPPTIKELWKLQILLLDENKIRGSIPSGLCYLSNMGVLDLGKNKFSNSVPACFENITYSLRYLYLYSNKLTSSIPTNLWRLKDILELDLCSNSLTGYITPEIGSLKVVTTIDLSRNRLSGIIPSTIVGLQAMSILFLDHNRLQGPLPESLGKLLSLEFLDLSHNNITGTIPKSLEMLLFLKYLNISHNKLRGEIPNGGPFANFTYQNFLSNEDLCGAPRFLVPLCKSSSLKRSKKKRMLLVAYISLAGASMVLALAFIFFLIKRQRRSNVSLENDLLPAITHGRISYYELQRATHEFNEINLLGKGGFGSVYKGILTDGTHLAVKVFNLQLEGAFNCFDTECEVLRNLRHRNLTKVISSCSNLDFKAIVLEYMPNGSLEKWLYSHNYFLDILQRLDIMIDVAHALDYLHHGYSSPVIHCDLKPSNVLLDEYMVAHVSDFGIAKLLGEGSTALTKTLATLGYIAPEYGLEGLVSTRCDIYSYGIMLMETFTRTNPCDEKFTGDLSLKNWVKDCLPNEIIQVIDANLVMLEDEDLTLKVQCVSSVLELALKCSTESPKERISMREVVVSLQKIRLQFLAKCERP